MDGVCKCFFSGLSSRAVVNIVFVANVLAAVESKKKLGIKLSCYFFQNEMGIDLLFSPRCSVTCHNEAHYRPSASQVNLCERA